MPRIGWGAAGSSRPTPHTAARFRAEPAAERNVERYLALQLRAAQHQQLLLGDEQAAFGVGRHAASSMPLLSWRISRLTSPTAAERMPWR